VPLSAVDVISPALERIKNQLFRPFRFRQWLRLALVGFLAGEMGQGGGCSVRLPLELLNLRSPNQFQGPITPRGPLFLLLLVLAVLLILVVGVVFAYLNSRMRFVLFDSVVDGECRIRYSWNRRGTEAFGYFIFQIVLSIVGLLSLIVLFGLPVLLAFQLGWFENARQHILGLVLGGVLFFCLFLIWMITLVLVQVLTKDFVIPQMAIEGVSLSEGWSRLWSFMKGDKGSYAGYIGMKILLALAAAFILGIAGLIVLIVLLIPFGLVAILGVVIAAAANIGWNPVTMAIAIVFGAIGFLSLILLVALISVPAIVFFPAYSIYFFAERYPALRALLYPPPPEPDLSNLSPQP
jgi:hypothetical protein